MIAWTAELNSNKLSSINQAHYFCTLPKPDDVLKDELPAAAAAGMSTDNDLGMLAFGLSALATPSGSVSTASVKPGLTSALNGVLLASIINKITHKHTCTDDLKHPPHP